ncbi:MAG: sigma-70 family RNA polymerase sigma factor [Xanthomonadaceae bacterium]|nr:sigma-70 family RNA polymerase sigma factor [Xanthomonadaceae bacterium]
MNAITVKPALDCLIGQHLPAAARGDTRAYGHVVRACQNTVTGIALAHVRDVAASEDIAQEAFLKAWQNLASLNNPDSFLPWLRQITRNLARDHLRARKRRREVGDDIDVLLAQVADAAPCPAERQAIDEDHAIATALIDRLPEDSREVLLLYYREGQSSQQVAGLLGLSDAAVRKRLSRARAAVRSDLVERLGEFARASAPSAAFTALVTTALIAVSPPVAAASILASGAAGAGASFFKLLTASAGAMAIGVAAAFAGIFFGLRRQLAESIDDTERRQLIRSALINAGATIGFLVGMVTSASWTRGWIAPVAATLAFMATILWQSAFVQPRILRRRHALEAQRDPMQAAKRRRRERILCWLGAATGTLMGGGSLIWGLIASGRL